MKYLLGLFSILFVVNAFAQPVPNQAPDCQDAEYVCSDNGTLFSLSIGPGAVDDIPSGSTTSNPSSNPGAAGNSGCLLSGELNPNWFVINIGSTGVLEFTIGSSGSSGFYDWALWPYYDGPGGSACTDIQNNTLPPAACNWNGSSGGFTGMYAQGSLPAGANQSNFEYAIPVVAGEQYVLCFSNFSSGSGNVPLTFGNDIPGNNNPNSAIVSCTPDTPDQTICLGETADVTITAPPVIANPTFNWLVTTGVSNPTGGVNVQVTPTVTTEYHVEIFENGALAAIDTFTIFVQNPQQPNAGPDQSICLGDIIQLNGALDDPTNNTGAWSYDVSGVSPTPTVNFIPNVTTLNAQVSVNQTGIYEFILEEDNAICGVIYDTVLVDVSELDITASAVAPSCEGFADGEIHITSLDAIEYSFDGGNTWVVDSFDVVFNAGTYTVCGRTATGCQKCVDVDVIDPAPVQVYVSNDTLICENGTAYMSAWATGGTLYTYTWDHTVNTGAYQDVNPAAQTTYTVFATNQNGCVSQPASIDVSVRPPLSGAISSWDTICPGYPTTVSANVAGGIGQPYQFNWSSGETHNGAGTHSISANPPVTQDYTVTITDGCESTPLVLTTNIRVAPLPEPQYQVLDPVQCEPAIFTIVNTTDPTMSQYVYWEVDGIHQYLNQDTIVSPEFWHGEYEIYMMVTSYEGCVDSIRVENALYVQPKPVANFGYAPNPVTAFNTTVSFSNYSFNGYTYEWYFEGGYPSSSTQEDVEVEFPDGVVDTYDITLITTSELGCTDTMYHELVVQPEILIYAPNTFTPDGDEFNQNWRVYMEGVDQYDWVLTIFNRWGETIWESNDMDEPWDGTYNGTLVPDGTYPWTIRTRNILNDEKVEFRGHVNIIR